jgi:hypothetical protein
MQLVQPAEDIRAVPRHEQEPNMLSQQASSGKRQTLYRRLVHPLRIIDDAKEGLFFGYFAQKTQDAEPHQKPVGWLSGQKAKCCAESPFLRRRYRIQAIQERSTELVQSGEGKFHLGFDPGCPHEPEPGCNPDGELEERRLAYARIAAQHETLALPILNIL